MDWGEKEIGNDRRDVVVDAAGPRRIGGSLTGQAKAIKKRPPRPYLT